LYDVFVGKSISPFPIRDMTLMKKSLSAVRPSPSDTIYPAVKEMIKECRRVNPEEKSAFKELFDRLDELGL
jgi:hypothetical protein